MEPTVIEDALVSAEAAVADHRGLAGTGFWNAVSMVKKEPELADRYADRMAAVDKAAFEDWALLTVPMGVGTMLMTLATMAGIALVGAAYYVESESVAVLVFYVGLGVLLVTTHGLAHLIVGRASGIRFTHWFIGTITMPQPGVKVDYSTYLRTDAKSRAWMHASGALATKAVPLVLVGAAVAAGLPSWATWGLVLISAATILTDILWSTKSSDWAKFNRERRFAQPS